MGSLEKVEYQYAYITDVGCVRELNEDSLFCSDDLWVVADGMGGHACGEVASQMAVEQISAGIAKNNSLSQAIQHAHEVISHAGKSNSEQSGMGTTVVAVTSNQAEYTIAWVGDSRIYLWDANKKRLSQLTEDHSLVVRLIKSGLLTAEDAKKHPQRHMITQCLGSPELKNVQVDTLQQAWRPNQQLLLCSDGLSDDVSEEEISGILRQDLSNDEKLNSLVSAAKNAGGKDNISIILVDSPLPEKQNFWNSIKSVFAR